MSETKELFATCGTGDFDGAGIGVIWWATHPPGDYALTVLDYQLDEMTDVNAAWIERLFTRSTELATQNNPITRGCPLRVDHPGLLNILEHADSACRDTRASRAIAGYDFRIEAFNQWEKAKWPATFDERMFAIRPLVNSGKIVKLETGLRRFSFRAIRTNHLVSQIKQHRSGDATSAGELLHAFVLGVLYGASRKSKSFFEAVSDMQERKRRGPSASTPSKGPFGSYIQGKRPL